tara:strand:- start:140 stop:325 length:186 start_codon:yes stop_codon:yes gene_type:complete
MFENESNNLGKIVIILKVFSKLSTSYILIHDEFYQHNLTFSDLTKICHKYYRNFKVKFDRK